MKEIQISNITQKISLIERQLGKYKLSIQSENNKPFRVCVNTEKYFDNNSPSYKYVNDGFIDIDIDADKTDVYELMILCDSDQMLTVRYNLQLIDDEYENIENNKKIHDERKQKLTDIANFAVNLDPKYNEILNDQLKNISILYRDQFFEDADKKLIFLHDLIHTNLTNVFDYLTYIKEKEEKEEEEFNRKSESYQLNQDLKHVSGFFSLSTLNIVLISIAIFFILIYVITKFSNKIPSTHIFI